MAVLVLKHLRFPGESLFVLTVTRLVYRHQRMSLIDVEQFSNKTTRRWKGHLLCTLLEIDSFCSSFEKLSYFLSRIYICFMRGKIFKRNIRDIYGMRFHKLNVFLKFCRRQFLVYRNNDKKVLKIKNEISRLTTSLEL